MIHLRYAEWVWLNRWQGHSPSAPPDTSAITTVTHAGGKMKLLNVTKKMRDLLAITKLLTVFETFDNEQDAVKSFN